MASAASSVILAAPHHGLVEGIRSLLATEFDTVVMVSDSRSLCESVQRLEPRLAVVDLAIAEGDVWGLIERLRAGSPDVKVILLSADVEATVVAAAKQSGADGLVNKREIASDLLAAVDAVLGGGSFFEGVG